MLAVRLLATTISYASGNAGGIFAPTLYIGAMAGGAVGVVVRTYAPFATAEPGAYALVGMGTRESLLDIVIPGRNEGSDR